MISFTIIGEPASKSNSRRLVSIGGKPRFIKSKKALDYVKSLKEQLVALNLGFPDPMLVGPLAAHITIYYASRRPDLDESLILDALQDIIYKNDRQIKEKHIYSRLDRTNPRADIMIAALPESFAHDRGRAA